ncbi:hypothetical protein D3C85_1238750 [compost metagenome]
MRAFDQGGEQTHQTPGQRCLVEQGDFGNFVTAQHAAVQLPHEAAWQLHVDGGGDATTTLVIVLRVFGKRQFEPLGDAIALHQGDFVFQRRQGVATHPAHHQAAQVVEAVAVDDHEAGVEVSGIGHREVSGWCWWLRGARYHVGTTRRVWRSAINRLNCGRQHNSGPARPL